MEEQAVQTKEERDAREAVSLSLARARRIATEPVDELDARPPHMR